MSKRPWFRQRTIGVGWTPITWKGWLVTLLGLVVFIAIDVAIVAHFGGR